MLHGSGGRRGCGLIVGASGWSGGILLGWWMELPLVGWLMLAACVVLVIGLCWSRPSARLVAFLPLWLCLGAAHLTLLSPKNDPHAIGGWIGQKGVSVQGTIVEEPHLAQKSTHLLIDVQGIRLSRESGWQEAHGKITAQIPGATFADPYGPHDGYQVQLTGTLNAPETYGTPEIQASMAFPALFIKSEERNPVFAWLHHLRTTLAGILLQVLPQPLAALMIAIVLNLRTPALEDLANAFNVTGTSHLLAARPYHV